MQLLEREIGEARNICKECKAQGFCVRGGHIFMTWQGRFILFMLSSLSTVIIPAVALSLFHTLDNLMPYVKPFILGLCLVPLAVVMIVCFVGLYYSIFKIKACRNISLL
jgi:hypothetical protein